MEIMVVHRKTYHDEDIFSNVAVKALRATQCPTIVYEGELSFLVKEENKEEAERILTVLNEAFVTEFNPEYVSFDLPFKDESIFKNGRQFVCYVPIEGDTWYTPDMFLTLCRGDGQLANRIFQLCDGKKPETIIEEGLRKADFFSEEEKCG